MDNFKLDINIPQKEIQKMARQVIREIVEEKISEALNGIDVNKVINDKLNASSIKIGKLVTDKVRERISSLEWQMKSEFKAIAKQLILEEIQKKPLSGNVYLKLDSSNIETDYDY